MEQCREHRDPLCKEQSRGNREPSMENGQGTKNPHLKGQRRGASGTMTGVSCPPALSPPWMVPRPPCLAPAMDSPFHPLLAPSKGCSSAHFLHRKSALPTPRRGPSLQALSPQGGVHRGLSSEATGREKEDPSWLCLGREDSGPWLVRTGGHPWMG